MFDLVTELIENRHAMMAVASLQRGLMVTHWETIENRFWDHYRKALEEIESLQSELRQVKAQHKDMQILYKAAFETGLEQAEELAQVKAEVRHIIENQLCEPCDVLGWLEKIAAPAQEVMEIEP